MSRKIIHLDLDAFFCAAEELTDPALRGKPFAVGGKPNERGVVASCSYAARMRGVRSAMPTARALRLCPQLILVPARHKRYEELSDQVMSRLRNLTPLVEQISIDEAFLDVSDLPQPTEEIARALQRRIQSELSLPCSVGVAANKLIAKIANEAGKSSHRGEAPPNALTVVPPGQESAFLDPLPCEMLWGVGPKTAVRLAGLGIRTIGDIARWPENDLARRFGENGRDLARHARGVDDRPVVSGHEIKSISQETTFIKDVVEDKALERTLKELSTQVARRLRSDHLAGTTVRLKIRWSDFTTLSRQITLPTPTDQDDVIASTAIKLMRLARDARQAVRLIGVGVSNLQAPVRQLGLFDQDSEKSRRLQSALDQLREKFGEDAIQKGK
jgi:DNA polymerase-4